MAPPWRRWLQHVSKMALTWSQDDPKMAKMASRCPKMAQRGPNLAQDGPDMAPGGPNMAPIQPKMAPNSFQDTPNMTPKLPKMGRRWPQASSQMVSRWPPSHHHNQHAIKHKAITKRVGGSGVSPSITYELNIRKWVYNKKVSSRQYAKYLDVGIFKNLAFSGLGTMTRTTGHDAPFIVAPYRTQIRWIWTHFGMCVCFMYLFQTEKSSFESQNLPSLPKPK
jgi:hypothetical protein